MPTTNSLCKPRHKHRTPEKIMATLLYFHLKPAEKLLFFHVFPANKAQTGPGVWDVPWGKVRGKSVFLSFHANLQQQNDSLTDLQGQLFLVGHKQTSIRHGPLISLYGSSVSALSASLSKGMLSETLDTSLHVGVGWMDLWSRDYPWCSAFDLK